MTTPRELAERMRAVGFVFAPGEDIRPMLGGTPSDWNAFVASWDSLELDRYMADGGRYRRRRHARFAATRTGISRLAHGPHWQSKQYNSLHGGIERWFEPITDAIGASRSLSAILGWAHAMFGPLAPSVAAWFVEVHQFRIEARSDELGNPTPEGAHRDGVDFVCVMMIQRHNIASGTTTIHLATEAGGFDATAIGSFTLTRAFDVALVEDARVFHGVTAVEAEDPARPAFRDVLVVTFRRQP